MKFSVKGLAKLRAIVLNARTSKVGKNVRRFLTPRRTTKACDKLTRRNSSEATRETLRRIDRYSSKLSNARRLGVAGGLFGASAVLAGVAIRRERRKKKLYSAMSKKEYNKIFFNEREENKKASAFFERKPIR